MPEEKKEKEKTCFVIMPISDHPEYAAGHFGRVYGHIIKPACELAGFTPFRVDQGVTTNIIVLEIIKQLLESDMAICDLSSKNPNVMYELGIRQAFNLPVTFIKDIKTQRVFDTQAFKDIPYDESLRIDTVESSVTNIAETIKATYDNRGKEFNSLIGLLGIQAAEVKEKKEISADTALILNSLQLLNNRISEIETKPRLTGIPKPALRYTVAPVPLNKNETIGNLVTLLEISNLKNGQVVFHIRYGRGVFVELTEIDGTKVWCLQFADRIRRFPLDSLVGTVRSVIINPN